MTKTTEKPYPWGRTYLYSPYKGAPPRPGPIWYIEIIIILPLFKPMLLYLFNWAPPPSPSTASIEVLHMKAKIVKHHSWLSTSSQKYGTYNWRVIRLNCSGVFIVLAWAVWKVDNAIHQANHYPVCLKTLIHWIVIYLAGSIIQLFSIITNKFGINFLCVCPLIKDTFCHNIVKVCWGTTRLQLVVPQPLWQCYDTIYHQ